MADYTQAIARIMRELKRNEINLHSVLITENGNTIYEMYVPPFSADKPHRMYSETKSYVSMGIGCLIGEGKLNLDDRIVSFFPDKQPEVITREMSCQTVRDMLIMNTCSGGVDWFKPECTDRLKYYFAQKPVRPSGTLFHYDSTGSYVLGCLIERLSGMKLLDYLKLKFLDEIGEFENAEILATVDGTPWGDSALLCTTRAMERFARLLMQKGEWNGKQLIPRSYVEEATSFLTETNVEGKHGYNNFGYGYQVWRTDREGFALLGMGGQHSIVIPDKKLIFVCTGDNQFNPVYGDILHQTVIGNLNPDENRFADLNKSYLEYSKLPVAHGSAHSYYEDIINGAWFGCTENPMGIKRFKLCFEGEEGTFEYENAQGMKKLPFGMKKNVFGKFPELGYSDDKGNCHELTGFMYDDAVSAGWIEDRKLQIFVQIIDRYLGSCVMTFGFRDKNTCGIRMIKSAEDFLRTYNGWAGAYRVD